MSVLGLSKGCCLEVFKYSRASKKHSFVTPGICVFLGGWPRKGKKQVFLGVCLEDVLLGLAQVLCVFC